MAKLEARGGAKDVQRNYNEQAKKDNAVDKSGKGEVKKSEKDDRSSGEKRGGLEKSSFIQMLKAPADPADPSKKSDVTPAGVKYIRQIMDLKPSEKSERQANDKPQPIGIGNSPRLALMESSKNTPPSQETEGNANNTPIPTNQKPNGTAAPGEQPQPAAAVPTPDANKPAAPAEPTPPNPVTNQDILNHKNRDGETATEEAQKHTVDALMKYADEHKDKPDDISKYANYLQANDLYDNGTTTSDPVPFVTTKVAPGEMQQVMDKEKIQKGLEEQGNKKDVQDWLAKQQNENLEKVLEERTREYSDIPIIIPDPDTKKRMDTLTTMQDNSLNDPERMKEVAKLPPEKRAEYYKQVGQAYANMGVPPDEIEKRLNKSISEMARQAGEPAPVVGPDGKFLKTPEVTTPDGKTVGGNPLVQPPKTDTTIAIDKTTGNPELDQTTGLPTVYGYKDGRVEQVKRANGETVVMVPTGQAVTFNDKGEAKLVNNKTGADIEDQTGNNLYVHPGAGAVVAKDASGVIREPATGQPQVYSYDNTTNTGKPLVNPATGNPIVADEKNGATYEVDKNTGDYVRDGNGNPVYMNRNTGERYQDGSGRPVVADEKAQVTVVVDPQTGVKTVWDPRTEKLIEDKANRRSAIVNPDTNEVIAAALDDKGQPLKTTDGQYVQIDDKSDIKFIPGNDDRQLIVNDKGEQVKDSNGNQLEIDPKSGYAMAVDKDGKSIVESKSGGQYVYDPKTGKVVQSTNNHLVILNPKTGLPGEVQSDGTISADPQGRQLVINTETGTYLKDPKGNDVVVDPATNLPIANVKDGDKNTSFIVDPRTGEYVVDGRGAFVGVDPNARAPIPMNERGEPIKDPASGLTPVIDPSAGKPALDAGDRPVMINPETGKAQSYDPVTKKFIPLPPEPKAVLDANGTPLKNEKGQIVATDGMTDHKVLLDPQTNQVVTDPKTGRPLLVNDKGLEVKTEQGDSVLINENGVLVAAGEDGKLLTDKSDNTLVYDADGKQFTDGKGNAVVLVKESGAPIFTNKAGKPVKDEKSGLTLAADVKTGLALKDPVTGNPVVLHKESGAPIQVDGNGNVVKDAKGRTAIANPSTGELTRDENGSNVFLHEDSGLPVSENPETGWLTVVNPVSGRPMEKPGLPDVRIGFNKDGRPETVKIDKDGNMLVWDTTTNQQKTDPQGRPMLIDSVTRQTVVRDKNNQLIDAYTGQMPSMVSTLNDPRRAAWGAVRTTLNTIYWNAQAVSPSFANSDFAKSRAFDFALGATAAISMLMTWSPGTEGFKALQQGDPATMKAFSRDLAFALSYSNTPTKLFEFMTNKGVLPAKWQILDDGSVVRPAGGKAGENYPLEVYDRRYRSWHPVESAERAKILVNRPHGYTSAQAADGTSQIFDPETGTWKEGKWPAPRPAGAGIKTYHAIRTVTKFLGGAFDAVAGALVVYAGVEDIMEGVKKDDKLQTATGFLNLGTGTSFFLAGASSLTGIATGAGAALYAVGFALAFAGMIVSAVRDPKGFLYGIPGTWADGLIKNFKNVDVWKNDIDAEAELRKLLHKKFYPINYPSSTNPK